MNVTIPHDPEAEAALLGSMLMAPGIIGDVSAKVPAEAFFLPAHIVLFTSIRGIAADGGDVDLISILGDLRTRGELEGIGGPAAVTRLMNTVPTSANWPSYANTIMALQTKRDAIRGAQAVIDAATAPGARLGDVMTALENVSAIKDREPANEASIIEFLSPSQLRAFNPPAGWNLVGDFHLQRESVTVIGGAPGIGKSRAATALASAGAHGPGTTWFGLPVHRQFRTMVIQTENGRVRLQRDFATITDPALDDWLRVSPPPPAGLRFDRPEFRAALRRNIRAFRPDVIVIDPWNAVAVEDRQKDYLGAFEAIRSAIPSDMERPAFVIVAHTRKPAANERASGAGLLATLAGSYVLGSVPRAAFVAQRASSETTDDRIVWTCCKNNDGEMGERSAWRRCDGYFAPVEEFDWQTFDNPDAVAKREIDEDTMDDVFDGKPLIRSEAVRRLKDRGFAKTAAYDALKDNGRFSDRLTDNGGVLTWN